MEDIKKRAKNFSVGEIKLLFDLVKEKRSTLERRRAASAPIKDRNTVWEDIENSFNNLSGTVNEMQISNTNKNALEIADAETNCLSFEENRPSTIQTIINAKANKLNKEQYISSNKECGVYKQKNASSSVEIRNGVGIAQKEDKTNGTLKQKNVSSSVEIRNVLKLPKEDKHSNSVIELEKKWTGVNSNSTPKKKSQIKVVKETLTVSDKAPNKNLDATSSEEIRNVLCILKKTEKPSDIDSDYTSPDTETPGRFTKEKGNGQNKSANVSSSEEIRKVLHVSQKEKRSDADSDSTSLDADSPVGVTTRLNHYQIIKKCGEPTPSTVRCLENKFRNLLGNPHLEEKQLDTENNNGIADRDAPKYGNSNVTVVLSDFSFVGGTKNDKSGLGNTNKVLEPARKTSLESKESQSKKCGRVDTFEEHCTSEFVSPAYSLSGFKKKPAEEPKENPDPSSLSSSSTFFLTHNLDKVTPKGSINILTSAKTELVTLQKQIHEQQLQFDREEQMLKVREHFLRLEILKLDIRLKQLDIKLKEKNLNGQ